MLIENTLKKVIESSSTIDELISQNKLDISKIRQIDSDLNIELNSWKKIASNDNWIKFSNLLRDKNLFENNQKKKIRSPKISNSVVNDEAWHQDAEWILREILRQPNTDDEIIEVKYSSIPFIHLFSTLISESKKKLLNSLNFSYSSFLTEIGISDLERLLVNDLSDLYSPLIFKDFDRYRKDSISNKFAYSDFIKYSKQYGFCQLLTEYPVLLRLLSVLIRQWMDTTSEFMIRLGRDSPLICKKIAQIQVDNKIISVSGSLSDKHSKGRSVLLITLQDGEKFLYKPKFVTLENNFYELICSLNSISPPIDLRGMETLDMGAYGWTEFIENKSCKEISDFKNYYYRAGCLLAIFYILQGKDIHDENIVANGCYPIPIDLEVLFQSNSDVILIQNHPAFESLKIANSKISNSVLSVGLLPNLGYDESRKVYDVGGLNGNLISTNELVWENINSYNLSYKIIQKTSSVHTNIPNFENVLYGTLSDNYEHLINGFKDYSFFITSNGKRIFEKFLNLNFKDNPIRTLKRPTAFYALLLKRLRNYKNFKSGFEWSVQSEFLCRYMSEDSQNNDVEWSNIKAEKEALLNLSIPSFNVTTESSETSTTSHDVQGICSRQQSIYRLENYSTQEILYQCDLIRWSLDSIISKKGSKIQNNKKNSIVLKSIPNNDEFNLLINYRIDKIYHLLNSVSIRSYSSVSWIGLDWFDNSEIYKLNTLGNGLYSGNAGIAIFLAAYSKIREDKEALILCDQSLSVIKYHINSSSTKEWIKRIGIGAGSGAAAIIYSLATIFQISNKEEYFDLSTRVSEQIHKNLIKEDNFLDIISGSSGLIMALLKLHKISNNEQLIDIATYCGHIICLKIQDRINSGKVLLNGFSHGLAGISYSLMKLYEISNEIKFYKISKELINLENDTYNPEYSNWPDKRVRPMVYDESKWCHGACGIGLSRAGLLKIKLFQDDKDLINDLSMSLNASNIYWPSDNMTLCCGSTGNIELLNSAGRLPNSKEHSNSAQIRLYEILKNYDELSLLTWGMNGEAYNLGFFQGVSGVGYSLIRTNDKSLPNIALFE